MSYHDRTTKDQPQPTKVENPGVVLSDSLAAESATSGGAFGTNPNPSVLAQSSQGSTANNADTSGATTLAAAPDASARPTSEESSNTSGSGEYDTSTSSANKGSAPSYVNAGGVTSEGGYQKPKGKNLTEGGFSSDTPNASFGTKIGGGGDPGRVALGEFEKRNARAGDDIGREGAGRSENAFEGLGRDEDA